MARFCRSSWHELHPVARQREPGQRGRVLRGLVTVRRSTTERSGEGGRTARAALAHSGVELPASPGRRLSFAAPARAWVARLSSAGRSAVNAGRPSWLAKPRLRCGRRAGWRSERPGACHASRPQLNLRNVGARRQTLFRTRPQRAGRAAGMHSEPPKRPAALRSIRCRNSSGRGIRVRQPIASSASQNAASPCSRTSCGP
jgi:hypothetical protein